MAFTGPLAMHYYPVDLKSELQLDCFADISFAPQGEKSHQGLLVKWGPNVLSWKSGRQPLVTLSTTEAELVGSVDAAESAKAAHLILHEMLGSSSKTRRMKATVWCDNQSALAQMMKSSASSIRTRHLSIRSHRLSDDINNGVLALAYVDTESQCADCLTKAYPKPLMQRAFDHLALSPL